MSLAEIDALLNDFDHGIRHIEGLRRLARSISDVLRNEEYRFGKTLEDAKKFTVTDPASDIVQFDVGGTIFSTLKTTISKRIRRADKESEEFYEPNLLEALATGLVDVKLDANNAIFIDRNAKYFGQLLDYLRMANTEQKFELPTNEIELGGLLKEAEFYRVQGLKDLNRKLIESEILSANEIVKLIKLCKFKRLDKWRLLYRGSRDGFGSNAFHSRCDGQAKTLVVVKAVNSNIFGGYTDAPWSSDGCWANDPKAFLFSLMNKEGKMAKFNSVGPESTYSNLMFGPTFGGGYDLYIADNANLNASSYSNLGCTYRLEGYSFGSNDATSFLAGSFSFQVAEIEVFKKLE